MTLANPIEQSYLKKFFRYDAVTNILERKFRGVYWKVVKLKPGKRGYSHLKFNGKNIQIHRLIYTLVHGNIDEGMHVDHWDGNPENNKLSNLQLLSHRDNLAKSLAGINPCLVTESGKYKVQAQADFDGKNHSFYFKYFKDKSEAQLLCDAFNALFGWKKPLYKAKLGTHDEWLEYMGNFKSQYVN